MPLAGGTPTQVAQVGSQIWNLALDENRNLPASNDLRDNRVDVQTGLVLQTFSTNAARGVAVEHATADPIVFANTRPSVYRLTSAGLTLIAPTLLTVSSGIAIVASAAEYGVANPGLTDYAFRTFPGVGGLPIAGNASYTGQVDAASGNNNLGVLAMSFDQSSLPVLGIQLLVDPASAIAAGAFPAGVPMPSAFSSDRFRTCLGCSGLVSTRLEPTYRRREHRASRTRPTRLCSECWLAPIGRDGFHGAGTSVVERGQRRCAFRGGILALT